MKKSFLCLACLFLLGGCAGDKQQRTEETANNLTYREQRIHKQEHAFLSRMIKIMYPLLTYLFVRLFGSFILP